MDRLIGFIFAILIVVTVLIVGSLIVYFLISGFNYLSFLIKDIFNSPEYQSIQKNLNKM